MRQLKRRLARQIGTGWLLLAAAAASAQVVSNGGFEIPDLPAGGWSYGTLGAGWTFTNGSGLAAAPNVAWRVPSGWAGDQVALLQRGSNQPMSAFSQDITLPADGAYELSYLHAGRILNPSTGTGGNLVYDVWLDSAQIANGLATVSGQTFTPVSLTFGGAAGLHVLKFQTGPTATADHTAFFDQIAIVQVPEPAPCLGGDDFNDNVKDPLRWGEDITDPTSPSQVQEIDERLRFTGSSMATRPWVCSYGSYLLDWEVVADVHLGEALLTADRSHVEVFLVVLNVMDTNINYGLQGGDHLAIALDVSRYGGETTERFIDCYLRTNWVEIRGPATPTTDTRQASFRLTFAATTKTLSAWYDPDGRTNGYSWTLLRTAPIDRPECNWEMNEGGMFRFVLGYSSAQFTVGASHEVWADNFMVNGAVTAPVLRITQTNGIPVLHLWGDAGRRYAIEYESRLPAGPNWQHLTTVLLTASPHAQVDSSVTGQTQRFYRAKLVP